MLFTRRVAARALVAIMVAGSVFAPVAGRAQTTVDVAMDAQLSSAVTANWGEVGGNLTNERYSSLDQIATWNVANLKPAWVTSLVSGPGAKKYWTKYNQ